MKRRICKGALQLGCLTTLVVGVGASSAAFGQLYVPGDVDSNGVVTCRDVTLAKKALGTRTGDAGYFARADLNSNGVVDGGDIAAIEALLPADSICEGVPTYIVVEGHDGSPDPDDNLAQLAGHMGIKRNSQRNPRVAWGGMIFGDTTTARRATMLSGTDAVSHANYEFHLLFDVPAIVSVGGDSSKLIDSVPEPPWNYAPTTPDDITPGSRLLYNYIKSAIEDRGLERVVNSAGGGQHSAAEAIALLRHEGYSDDQIFDHFAVVQHSAANSSIFTEVPAQDITFPFVIRIDDQNGSLTSTPPRFRSGPSDCTASAEDSCFPPISVGPACTSSVFATAWHAASTGGAAESGIPNHEAIRDASDAGEPSFATRTDWIDTYWNTRNRQASSAAPGNVTAACNAQATESQCIVYAKTTDGVVGVYSKPQMDADMNCSVAVQGFEPSITSAPAVNSANPGSAVPVRFTATSFEGRNVSNIVSVTSQQIVCESGQTTGAVEGAVSAAGRGVQYEGGVYRFDWKTDKSWGGTCRQFQVQVNGVSLAANFKFRK